MKIAQILTTLSLLISVNSFAANYETTKRINCTNATEDSDPETNVSVTILKENKAVGVDKLNAMVDAIKAEVKEIERIQQKQANGEVLTKEEEDLLITPIAYNNWVNAAHFEVYELESYQSYLADQVTSKKEAGLNTKCQKDASKPNRLVYTAQNIGPKETVLEAGEGIINFGNTKSILSINTQNNTALFCQSGTYKDENGQEHSYGSEKATTLNCSVE